MRRLILITLLSLSLLSLAACVSGKTTDTYTPEPLPSPVVYKLRELNLGSSQTISGSSSVYGSFFLGIGSVSGSGSIRTNDTIWYYFYTEDDQHRIKFTKTAAESAVIYEDGLCQAIYTPEKVNGWDIWHWELHIPTNSIQADYNVSLSK